MPVNYENTSATDRILYSPLKALDMALGLGAVPVRLFRIFYPIWRVQVEGHQRIATDFEELEWFMERGLSDAGLTSMQDLSHFFGLEERFVRQLINFLTGIGHISGSESQLSLTELGKASVQARVRYEEQQTSAQLYFDGLGSRPLSSDHYKIPVYDTLPEFTRFQAFYHFSHQWNEDALKQLLARSDRMQYNLPDEVTNIQLLGQEPAYLPIYIIQRQHGDPLELPLFLVFSRIRTMRDQVIEEAVNKETDIRSRLQIERKNDLEQSVADLMEQFGLSQEDWYFKPSGARGAEVRVDGEVFRHSNIFTPQDKSSKISIRDIGKYNLAYEWCVWLTCDNADVRKQAAIEQLLEWLQNSSTNLKVEDIQKRMKYLSVQLDIEPVSSEELYILADQRNLSCAMERLNLVRDL